MKKKHIKWGAIILWVFAFFFLISIPSGFRDSFGMGLTMLAITAILAFLGYMIFSKEKRTVKKATAKAREERVTQLREKMVADKARQEEADRHRVYVEGKQREFATELSLIPQVDIEISATKVKRQPVTDLAEIRFTNITRSTNLDSIFPFVVIDTETTGLKPVGNDIIEVSAIRFERGFQPVSCFSTLLKPRNPIPEDATRVNNITDDMVAGKPTFSQIAEAFSSYISGCNVVGHNLEFDIKFVYACGATLPEKKRFYDTLALAKNTLSCPTTRKWDNDTKEYSRVDDYDVENYKLTTLCNYYGIYRPDAHRSLSDCYATALLFENLIEDKRNRP